MKSCGKYRGPHLASNTQTWQPYLLAISGIRIKYKWDIYKNIFCRFSSVAHLTTKNISTRDCIFVMLYVTQYISTSLPIEIQFVTVSISSRKPECFTLFYSSSSFPAYNMLCPLFEVILEMISKVAEFPSQHGSFVTPITIYTIETIFFDFQQH